MLAYRAVNFWLPIPFGGLAYASLEFERRPAYRKLADFLHRRFERSPAAAPGRHSSGPRRAHLGQRHGHRRRQPVAGRHLHGLQPLGRGQRRHQRRDAAAVRTGTGGGGAARRSHFVDPGGMPEPAFGSDPAG